MRLDRSLTLSLLVVLALGLAERRVTAAPREQVRLLVGAQLGFPQFVGVSTTATFFKNGRPRFDLDFLWEPSGMLQSYSIGAAYHPADRMFFLGSRLRLMQLEAPWARGYDRARDNHLGIGLEAGLRAGVGPKKRTVIALTLQATGIPTQATPLQWIFGLNLGVSFAVLERPLR